MVFANMEAREKETRESFRFQLVRLSANNPGDIEKALGLLDRQWETAGQDLKALFPELYPNVAPLDPEEINKKYWAAKQTKTGDVIGVIGFSEFPQDVPEHAWLGWFLVTPTMRGKGIGARMVDQLTQELTLIGKTDLFVQTSDRPEMVRNAKFYDPNGFLIVISFDTTGDGTHIKADSALPKSMLEHMRSINAMDIARGITIQIRRKNLSIAPRV